MARSLPLAAGNGMAPRRLRQPDRPARTKYRVVMLWLAFACIMTTGVALSVGGLNFPLERIYALAFIPALVYRLLSPGNPAIKKLLWLWVLWCGVLLVSALASGNAAAHIVPWVIALVPVCYFALIAMERVDSAVIDRIVRVLLWVFGISGTIILILSRIIGPEHIPFTMVDLSGRLRLTVVEPNLLGSTMGFMILLSLARSRMTTGTIAMQLFALITLVGAFSKGPLIAFMVAFLLFWIFRAIARRSNLSLAVILPIWISALGAVALISFLSSVLGAYNTLLARQDAISARSYVYQLAMARFWDSPLIGRGPGDFGLLNPNLLKAIGGQDVSHNLWIAQMMINILHDSGIIGLAIYVMFLGLVLRRGYRWVRAGSVDHAGYLAAFISVVIASQTSTVHLNGIFGLAAGLVVSMPIIQQSISNGDRTKTVRRAIPA